MRNRSKFSLFPDSNIFIMSLQGLPNFQSQKTDSQRLHFFSLYRCCSGRLDGRQRTVLLPIRGQRLERNSRAPANLDHHVPLGPLVIRQALAQHVAQISAVHGRNGRAAGHLDEQPRVVGEAHAADGGVGIADDYAPQRVGARLAPSPGPLRDARRAQGFRNGRDGG